MRINKVQMKGRATVAKGAIKEVAGKLVGNTTMQLKGMVQKNVGKAQVRIDNLKRDLKDLSK